jgi:hypothetical protein
MARRSQRRAWCCGSRSEWEAVALSKRCCAGTRGQRCRLAPGRHRNSGATPSTVQRQDELLDLADLAHRGRHLCGVGISGNSYSCICPHRRTRQPQALRQNAANTSLPNCDAVELQRGRRGGRIADHAYTACQHVCRRRCPDDTDHAHVGLRHCGGAAAAER